MEAFGLAYWSLYGHQCYCSTDSCEKVGCERKWSCTALPRTALDPSKDPCLKVKCSPHKVCVTQDYQTALCVSRKHLLPRLFVEYMQWSFECGPTSESVTFLNKNPTAVVLCFANTFPRVLKKTEREWQKKGTVVHKHWVGPSNLVKCKPCPAAQSAMVCGSDGHTYTSKVPFVPEADFLISDPSLSVHPKELGRVPPPNLKRSDLMISEEGAERIFHDTNERGVIGLEHSVHEACTDKELRNLASRLKDWFGALHEDANRVIKPTSSETAQGRFDTSILPICKDSLGWMFNKLDMNYDLLLDHSEINAIYLDKYEPCIKPLFNSCDSFKDGKLSNNEWCYCFQKPGGAFIPRCNEEGYYKATQCHGSTGQCWCVDKYGNELAGSRKQGAVNCEEEQETSGDFGSGGSVVLLDDLEDEQELGPKDRLGKPRVHARAVTEDDEDEDDDKEDEVGYIW
ncbi:hypothetical protein MJG53_007575 [Ovis ammon polii x Ovis aries]|uniref:Uncharacterized protein n=1 Tax=Ovis ammon polii x Ovis aries TaxID=2918886 RepID=A0ACB9V312_9CETA|nr:hypothetical protein MJG53_007575 [Ovis ammon polii x Ovis aries]